MQYSIRPYRDDDAPALAVITHLAIEQIGPHRYSNEQVAAWLARIPDADKFRERAADGDFLIVAVDSEDAPVAYAILESDGHLDHLYCHPEHTRKGLDQSLLEEVERIA